jgi:Ca-activated chloride channel family protein
MPIRHHHWREFVLTVVVALVASPLTATPQNEVPAQLSVQVEVVTVPVTVTDARGEFVRGLQRQNFRLWVDGEEQPIEYFATEEEPAQVLMLVETGPAVFLLKGEHLTAANALIDGLGPADRIAIASYSDTPRLLLDFTTDKRQAAETLGSLGYGLGMAQLNFYDSLASAVGWMESSGTKRAIVVLTTGLDSSGEARWDRLAAKLQMSNVLVLPVALGEELRGPPTNSKKQSSATGQRSDAVGNFAEWDRALEGIAEEVGGHAFFPRSTKDFTEDYHRIASLLRHQYSLGFTPRVRDGGVHTIRVEIVDDRGAPFDGKEKRPAYGVNFRREFLAPGP